MKTVFVDTHYWLAICLPGDQWKEAASRAKSNIGDAVLMTTDEVLAEFLAGLSKGGQELRRTAVRMVRAILGNPNVQVIPQSHDSFLQGVGLYEERPDKEYSLTDCISMSTMTSHHLNEILTHDHHFTQEGFTVLMK